MIPIAIGIFLPSVKAVTVYCPVFACIDIICRSTMCRRVSRDIFNVLAGYGRCMHDSLVVPVGIIISCDRLMKSAIGSMPWFGQWSYVWKRTVIPGNILSVAVKISVISAPISVMSVIAVAIAVGQRTRPPVMPVPVGIPVACAVNDNSAVVIGIIIS